MIEIHAPTHATRRQNTHERLQPKHAVDANLTTRTSPLRATH